MDQHTTPCNSNIYLTLRHLEGDIPEPLTSRKVPHEADSKIPICPYEHSIEANEKKRLLSRASTRKPSRSSLLDTVLRRRKTTITPESRFHSVSEFELDQDSIGNTKSKTTSLTMPSIGATETIQEIPDSHARLRDQDAVIQNLTAIHKKEIRSRDARITRLENQLVNLATEITEIHKDRQRLQAQIKTAEEGPPDTAPNESWAPKTSRRVREELSMLEERMRSWAIEYSVGDLTALEHMSTVERNVILQQLDGYCAIKDWASLIQMIPVATNKIPALLTQAMISKDIFTSIFQSPFFAFDHTDKTRTPISHTLTDLYLSMLKVNEAEAHTWRSQTLRILSSSHSNANSESALSQRVEAVASDLAIEFLNGPVRALFREPRSDAEMVKRNQELYTLYHEAGELALSLWRHRAFMRFYTLNGLQIFRSNNPAITAHPLQHVTEGNRRLDGKQVFVVAQPAIIAYGNEHAQQYDLCKVWAKGVVIVDESEGVDPQGLWLQFSEQLGIRN